jgi:hypothetical protein
MQVDRIPVRRAPHGWCKLTVPMPVPLPLPVSSASVPICMNASLRRLFRIHVTDSSMGNAACECALLAYPGSLYLSAAAAFASATVCIVNLSARLIDTSRDHCRHATAAVCCVPVCVREGWGGGRCRGWWR